jgi:TRAP-type transport system periplasmic protein
MNKIFSGILASLLIAALIITGCSQTPSSPSPKAPAAVPASSVAASTQASAPKPAGQIVIKYGHDLTPDMAPISGLNWWAAEVTKRTEGRVKVDLYPSSTLATQADGLEAVRSGVADMYYISVTTHRKFFPISSIVQVPGIGFPDDTPAANEAHAAAFLEMLKKYPAAAAEFKDFAPVFFYVIYSESYLASKSKKVSAPADIKGMKVGSSGIRLDFINKIGGAGVTDVPPTCYEKMQTGVTDAGFAAISAVHDFKIYEVSKYVLDLPFGAGGMVQLINKKTWDKISPQDQKIMMDLAPQASSISSKTIGDLNAASWKEVEGMGKRSTVNKDEKALWDKEFQALWEQYIKEAETAGFKDARDLFNWWKSQSDKAWVK